MNSCSMYGRCTPPLTSLLVPVQDSVDLERVASFARYSPSTSAFLAGFLPSAQSLPGPLFTNSPPLADISPLPFATLHRPESAAPHVQSSGGLPTPTMISLAFGGWPMTSLLCVTVLTHTDILVCTCHVSIMQSLICKGEACEQAWRSRLDLQSDVEYV